MGLDFRIKDFAYPFAILKFKNQFDRDQWLDKEELYSYQLRRLKTILDHASRNVPYYEKLFKKNNISPSDIKTTEDLKHLPYLDKDKLISNFDVLVSRDIKKYQPTLQKTSGTSGRQVMFCTDKPSNILEFVYYWRNWGWAGYRLGDKFAELSAQYFTPYEVNGNRICQFNYLTRRLMVNSLMISLKNIGKYIAIFNKYKPLFLKGLPSNLYALALIFAAKKNYPVRFKAVFSQGENLLEYQRKLIERVFSCKVFDSYGLMERVAAISECPQGNYHYHLDYSLIEFEKTDFDFGDELKEDEYIAEVIGTSLHNFSMPLIRYRTGDYVKIKNNDGTCSCKRNFPLVQAILGRSADIVITPDKRAITALYVALDRTPGIIMGQIIQERIDKLLVRIACDASEVDRINKEIKDNLRHFLGPDMKIEVVYQSVDEIREVNKSKFKSIISKVPYQEILP